MKKYLFAICALSIFLVGCSDKKAQWKAGCKAAASDVLAELRGISAPPEAFEAPCDSLYEEQSKK